MYTMSDVKSGQYPGHTFLLSTGPYFTIRENRESQGSKAKDSKWGRSWGKKSEAEKQWSTF